MGATSCWIPYDTDDRPIQLVLATFGQAFPTALGIDGGYPANTAMYKMARRASVQEWFARGEIPGDIAEAGGELQYLPQKCEILQEPDDVFEHTWSGGGGFGDPLDRDPAKAAVDVRNDAVSIAAAQDVYGVVLDGNGRVDTDATSRRREEIRTERVTGYTSSRDGARGEAVGRQLDHHLAVDDGGAIVCRRCGYELSSADENFKAGAVAKERPIQEANPLIVDPRTFIDDEVVFRQYFCPGCATLLCVDVYCPELGADEPLWDTRFELAQFAAEPAR